ncbi:MAG: hypothetical protein ACK4PR_08445 [Gammaproteobacteria bacterium]
MFKQKLMISDKQAEKLIYYMVRYSNHSYSKVRNYPDHIIKEWFKLNKYEWRSLLRSTRMGRLITMVENFAHYDWFLRASDGVSVTVTAIHEGHEIAKLKGAGQINLLDYHTKFMQALTTRETAVKKGNIIEVLNSISNGSAAIESYINSKADMWNRKHKKIIFQINVTSNLDEKLTNWLILMTGNKINQSDAVWSHFTDLKTLNNKGFKHSETGARAFTFNDMVKILNKFRTGIATLLFKLHMFFSEPVPSRIIRAMYLPDVFI